MTDCAEILQVKKEWQMCIVERFLSLGKATWMKIGLKSGQEMMRLFFSLQIWILYEMLLHQTVLLFNLAELSSFPWLFFQNANMVLALVENHPHHQPWYHHCDCASDLIRSTEFMRAVWCEYAILPRISCNLCIYADAIQNDEHGDQIKIIFFFFKYEVVIKCCGRYSRICFQTA